ncbi:MAG: MFS transporter [Burkholderiaceae bacterium]|nr:MFS transporter [Burkholderiaceae bacterium]
MKIFYGWRIALAASGIQFLLAGLLYQAFGAYVAVLTQEKGWSKTALSGGSALQAMEAAVLGPLLGWIIDRFGSRWMVRAGVLMAGIGFMVLSRIDTITGFYGAILVIALGSSLCGWFPLNVTVINWFQRLRARALSVVALGLSFGGLIVPLVALSMVEFGWRSTAFWSGVAFIVIGVPLASVFRNKPEEHGLTLDGLPPDAPGPAGSDASGGSAQTAREFSFREALRTSAFWLIAFGHGLALFVVTAVNTHAITHMNQGLGYTVGEASLVITLMTVSQVFGVLLGGWLGDRYPKRYVAAACMLMHCAGMLLLTWAVHVSMLIAFAIIHGTAWGLRGPFMQAIRADYFGRRAIGKIMGMSSLIVVIGQIGGPIIAGLFADINGNYRLGFTILALIAGSGVVLFLAAKPPR